jgi:hypothetical protein
MLAINTVNNVKIHVKVSTKQGLSAYYGEPKVVSKLFCSE